MGKMEEKGIMGNRKGKRWERIEIGRGKRMREGEEESGETTDQA